MSVDFTTGASTAPARAEESIVAIVVPPLLSQRRTLSTHCQWGRRGARTGGGLPAAVAAERPVEGALPAARDVHDLGRFAIRERDRSRPRQLERRLDHDGGGERVVGDGSPCTPQSQGVGERNRLARRQ